MHRMLELVKLKTTHRPDSDLSMLKHYDNFIDGVGSRKWNEVIGAQKLNDLQTLDSLRLLGRNPRLEEEGEELSSSNSQLQAS